MESNCIDPKKFSLKDQLFNKEKVDYLSALIKEVYPDFLDIQFSAEILNEFPNLELKERIYWIRENLRKYLPDKFENAVEILLLSLPQSLDRNKSDDDFGDFIFAPFSDFIAMYGCCHGKIDFSLMALERMTQNFSAEDSIRYFLNKFPDQTLAKVELWSVSSHYHVRRLASEGTRPKLPWCQKVDLDLIWVVENVLDNLFNDPTRYVVRSVANHLNDISKMDSDLVIKTLIRWKNLVLSGEKICEIKELDYLIAHSLRTLVKKGNVTALSLLGYEQNTAVLVDNFLICNEVVSIGNYLEFEFYISAEISTKLMIDYLLYFQDSKGNLKPKVFKIKKVDLKAGEDLFIAKKHRLKMMTTKQLYPGLHKIELQVNGVVFKGGDFYLK